MATDHIARVIRETLLSPNVSDSNGEAANVVDVIDMLAASITRSFCALHAAPDGRTDINMLEAVMEIASAVRYAGDGFADIGSALSRIATALEERPQ